MRTSHDTRELLQLIERLCVVKMCKHAPDVEAEYDDHREQKFQMCRDCWNEEKYHKIDKDTVQIVRPNQLSVVSAKCLKCGSGMDSCKCGT